MHCLISSFCQSYFLNKLNISPFFHNPIVTVLVKATITSHLFSDKLAHIGLSPQCWRLPSISWFWSCDSLRKLLQKYTMTLLIQRVHSEKSNKQHAGGWREEEAGTCEVNSRGRGGKTGSSKTLGMKTFYVLEWFRVLGRHHGSKAEVHLLKAC